MSRPGQVQIEIQPELRASSSRSSRSSRTIHTIHDLPSLPEPHTEHQQQESLRGIILVIGLTSLLVALPHLIGRRHDSPALFCLYGIAAAALFCLGGILCGDPGVVFRSDENCFPLPSAVAQRLRSGSPLDGMQNITTKSGKVFCVRCCIWRPATRSDIHHCSICQRCIRYHDHHCNVFGRCIAGRRRTFLSEGNLRYYYGLWLCLVGGIIASLVAMFA